MPDNSPPAPSSGEALPLNPYAAPSASGAERSASSGDAPASTGWDYHLRMSWAERRRLLRLAGPMRFYAMAGAVVGVWGLYSLVQLLPELWRSQAIVDSDGLGSVLLVIRIIGSMARGLLVLYVCWATWKLADTFVKAAGGTCGDLSAWSHWQSHLTWALLAQLILGLGVQAWEWFSVQYLLKPLLTPNL